MRKRAFNPNSYFAATSEIVFDKFRNSKRNISNLNRGVEESISTLKESILIDNEDSLNALKPLEETVIAVADKILKTYSSNPIIVVPNAAREKWDKYCSDFYTRHTSTKTKLAILSLNDTITFLKENNRDDFKIAKNSISNPILKAQIDSI